MATPRNENWQGGKWIRNDKRLAIYLRDGLCCSYCGASVESGAQLSLDHIKPDSKGGTNDATNLVTSCTKCNSSRGNRPLALFARAVAEYLNNGITDKDIVRHVRNCARRTLSRGEAKAMIARRGTAAKVLANI